MALHFCSFASGSSGNCYLVESDNTTLLVDVGITGKRILAGLEENGHEPEDVDGILLTHEHIDHVRSIRMLGRKAKRAQVFGSAGTLSGIEPDRLPEGRTHRLPDPLEDFSVGDIQVRPFSLSHDAGEPTGYSFCQDGEQITIVTDTGCITDDIFSQIREADILVLEANHEVNILQMGPYPYPLKQRILGDHGHLSNETAGNVISKMLDTREKEEPPVVLLGHLSRENNTPQQAFLTVRNILFENDYYVGQDLTLDVILRDECSRRFRVGE